MMAYLHLIGGILVGLEALIIYFLIKSSAKKSVKIKSLEASIIAYRNMLDETQKQQKEYIDQINNTVSGKFNFIDMPKEN